MVGTTVAIGLDPMVAASIRVLGTAAPAVGARLPRPAAARIPNEVFLLSYADADPAVTRPANAGSDLAPLGFDFAIDPADFGPAVTPTPDPDDRRRPLSPTRSRPVSPTGRPPPLPTTEDLLAWPATLESIAWPAEGTVGADGLATLAGLGYADVLLSGSNVVRRLDGARRPR